MHINFFFTCHLPRSLSGVIVLGGWQAASSLTDRLLSTHIIRWMIWIILLGCLIKTYCTTPLVYTMLFSPHQMSAAIFLSSGHVSRKQKAKQGTKAGFCEVNQAWCGFNLVGLALKLILACASLCVHSWNQKMNYTVAMTTDKVENCYIQYVYAINKFICMINAIYSKSWGSTDTFDKRLQQTWKLCWSL